jgi:plastocyanin
MVAILLAGIFGLTAAACGGSDGAGPEQPTYSFVIPAGSADRIQQGEQLDILPRELVAQLNETVIIVNEDDEAHVLGPWFVGAGETLRQRFTTEGVFEDKCTVHPSGQFTVVVEA